MNKLAVKTSKKTKSVKEKSLTMKKKELDDSSKKLADIILNPNRPYHEKLAYIKNELNESVREINFNYQIKGFLEDSAYAINRAVEKVHGFTTMNDKKSASKDNPPEYIDVKFADGSRIKVPYGQINLPQFGKNAYINMFYSGSEQTMHIEGVCEKRHSMIMDEIIKEAEDILNTDSIYKNQAIKYDGTGTPQFMDLSSVDKTELFLTPQAKFATEPIEARIESCEACLEKGIDLKFGVLLEGNYGTGKTLYANKLALKAIRNGWTFIYCAKPENTLEVLKMANTFTKNGTGVVLFVEDIDKILNVRNNVTNEISLLMDGSETKHNNIISIFSTNHVENIDPTFLRGKRIGSIVTLSHLDAETAERMLTYYLSDYIEGDLKKASAKVEEYKIVPAFLSEIIDRVKTHTILREKVTLVETDILNAIEQFKRQMDIATVKIQGESTEEKFYSINKELIESVVKASLDEIRENVEYIRNEY